MSTNTQKMFFRTVPLELQQLVWKFAYGMYIPVRPLYDLDFVWDKQNAIPPIFLVYKAPTRELFPNGWRDKHNMFWSIYIPNPYVKGNPYYPAVGIHEDCLLWSTVGDHLLDILSVAALKKMKTYRAILHKNFMVQMNTRVHEWNRSFGRLWSIPDLCDPGSFVTYGDYSAANTFFVNEVTRQLSEATYALLTEQPRVL